MNVKEIYNPGQCGRSEGWCMAANTYRAMFQDDETFEHNILSNPKSFMEETIRGEIFRLGVATFHKEYPQEEFLPYIKEHLQNKEEEEMTARELKLARKLGLNNLSTKDIKSMANSNRDRLTVSLNNPYYREWAEEWYSAFMSVIEKCGLMTIQENGWTLIINLNTGEVGRSKKADDDENQPHVGVAHAFARLCGVDFPTRVAKWKDIKEGDLFRPLTDTVNKGSSLVYTTNLCTKSEFRSLYKMGLTRDGVGRRVDDHGSVDDPKEISLSSEDLVVICRA